MVAWWQLPPDLARGLWGALGKARWSLASGLRAQIALWESQALQLDLLHVTHEVLAPHNIIRVVESLVQEGHLRRKQATQIEERILAQVLPNGRWM